MKQRYSQARMVFFIVLGVVLQVIAVAQLVNRLAVERQDYQYPGWVLGVGAAVWLAFAARALLYIYRLKDVGPSKVFGVVTGTMALLIVVVRTGFPWSSLDNALLDCAFTMMAAGLVIFVALQDHARWYVSAEPYNG